MGKSLQPVKPIRNYKPHARGRYLFEKDSVFSFTDCSMTNVQQYFKPPNFFLQNL